MSQKSDPDVYLKLIETFKFAFAQRSKIGDPVSSPYRSEIEKVGLTEVFYSFICRVFFK